jgi:transposase InsO family protein
MPTGNHATAFIRQNDRKNALIAADLLNDRVLPFFETHGIPLRRILTDGGIEYCGAREHHEYQLYLAIEDIDHSRTRARSPQSNGICERFHKPPCRSSLRSPPWFQERLPRRGAPRNDMEEITALRSQWHDLRQSVISRGKTGSRVG